MSSSHHSTLSSSTSGRTCAGAVGPDAVGSVERETAHDRRACVARRAREAHRRAERLRKARTRRDHVLRVLVWRRVAVVCDNYEDEWWKPWRVLVKLYSTVLSSSAIRLTSSALLDVSVCSTPYPYFTLVNSSARLPSPLELRNDWTRHTHAGTARRRPSTLRAVHEQTRDRRAARRVAIGARQRQTREREASEPGCRRHRVVGIVLRVRVAVERIY